MTTCALPKIGMITSWDQACGIADYSQALVHALQPYATVRVYPIPSSPRPTVLAELAAKVSRDNALAHIQHEYIFYGGRDPWNYHYAHLIKNLKIPHVVTAHTWLKPFHGGPFWKQGLKVFRDFGYRTSGWTQYLEAGQFQSARAVMVMNQAFGSALIQRGVDPARVHTLFQGVPKPVAGDAERARQRWQISGQAVLIFGFLNPAKGHMLALEAWQRMPQPPLLIIAGGPYSEKDYPYTRQLQAAAARFPQSVRLTGYLNPSELADLLAASELVLFPYQSSTSSYSLSLALAHGRAVLASDLACFQEIAEQKPCLELFSANDPEALARATTALLADAGKRDQLRTEAQAWAKAHSWPRMAEATTMIYHTALEVS